MTKVLCDGRLVVEPYPTKERIESEASRTDCSSDLFIHVEINHDSMSTVELFNLLKREYTIMNLSNPYIDKLELSDAFLYDILPSLPSLVERHDDSKDWFKPENSMNWYNPQMDIWEGSSDKFHFNMWINWCKNTLKKKVRYGDGKDGEYNPYEGLRLRVRPEFHD